MKKNNKKHVEKEVLFTKNWEKPKLEVININETNNGESDLLSEGSFWGWLFGSGHS